MAITVRAAAASDATVIAGFNRQLAEESEGKMLDPATVLAGVEALFQSPRRGRYFVAEADAGLVGQLLITYEWSDWRNGLFWWIQSVYVSAEYRRKGVFSALYAHVATLARATPGVCGLRLYVEERNTRAMATYHALGLSDSGYRVLETELG